MRRGLVVLAAPQPSKQALHLVEYGGQINWFPGPGGRLSRGEVPARQLRRVFRQPFSARAAHPRIFSSFLGRRKALESNGFFDLCDAKAGHVDGSNGSRMGCPVQFLTTKSFFFPAQLTHFLGLVPPVFFFARGGLAPPLVWPSSGQGFF